MSAQASIETEDMKFFPQGHQRDFQVLDDRIGFVLGVERIFMRILNRMFRAIVDLPERGREVGPLQLGERIGDEHRLHELLRHPDIEK